MFLLPTGVTTDCFIPRNGVCFICTQYGKGTVLIPHSSEMKELIEKKMKNLLYRLEQADPLHVPGPAALCYHLFRPRCVK